MVVGNLNFVIIFLISADEKQDFFLFEGVNTTAHLYRHNETIYLYMNDERKAAYYQTDVGSVLEFSWKGFKVNGTEMVKVKSDGEFPLDFNTFTFISPILHSHCSEILQKVYFNSPDLANVNYGYIVGIVTIVALIFDSNRK